MRTPRRMSVRCCRTRSRRSTSIAPNRRTGSRTAHPLGASIRAPTGGQADASVPSCLCNQHFYSHAEIVVGCTDEASSYGNGLADVPGYGNTYQVAAADRPVGRVIGNPAGARNVNVGPSMGGPGTCGMVPLRWIVEIPRHDPCSKTEAARCLDQQHGKIAAGTPTTIERLDRRLGPLGFTALVGDRPRDAGIEIGQQ